ncbi:hypothetical protein BaRGS_00030998 [Batillaria attramentaria]|uniref:Secreted protein n=1 Tax=Batillaria attramentaria TaxID=370345 RepID=A0ABD0JRW9_9CAEN
MLCYLLAGHGLPITRRSCKRVRERARCIASISALGASTLQNGWAAREADAPGRVPERDREGLVRRACGTQVTRTTRHSGKWTCCERGKSVSSVSGENHVTISQTTFTREVRAAYC